MLTEQDVVRFEVIMDRVFATREQRGYIPNRDEDRIAEILEAGDDAARLQHDLLVDSNYGSSVRSRDKISDSEDLRDFTSLSRWKSREVEE